jgi:hypothetical protein
VRAQLWPLLEAETGAPADAAAPQPAPAAPASEPPPALPPLYARTPRSQDEIVNALHLSYPTILEKLRQRAKPA